MQKTCIFEPDLPWFTLKERSIWDRSPQIKEGEQSEPFWASFTSKKVVESPQNQGESAKQNEPFWALFNQEEVDSSTSESMSGVRSKIIPFWPPFTSKRGRLKGNPARRDILSLICVNRRSILRAILRWRKKKKEQAIFDPKKKEYWNYPQKKK